MEQLFAQIKAFFELPFVSDLIAAAIVLLGTAVVAKLAGSFVRRMLHFDEVPLPSSSIFLNITRATIWFLGFCIVAQTCFNINVSALVAALGVGGIAVSLGFQDTISNLIGGLQVTLMRLVEPGDNISVTGVTGVVKDVTWRHTTIVDAAGEDITIPNALINKNSLTHLGNPAQIAVLFVVVGTDAANLDAVASALATAARTAATAISPVTAEAKVLFTEVTDAGFRGKVLVCISDVAKTRAATDAVVRAIAPLTR
ncbi:MAG: mechanosensitive ion channel [Raoultibacter sp.]